MPYTTTPFDTGKSYIFTDAAVIDDSNEIYDFRGIIDTGAPRTEFADTFLAHAGFVELPKRSVSIKNGMPTYKYKKLILPSIRICGQTIKNFEIIVSRFEESWGISALIGLDFFRQFEVIINYQKGHIITEPYMGE